MGMIVPAESDSPHVLGTRSLGTTTFVVFDGLTFAQIVESAPFDRRMVEEQFSRLALNETETLFRQLLDRTL